VLAVRGGKAVAGEESGQEAGRAPAESVSWVRVTALADLPPGSAREVRQGGRVYALFRLEDSVCCLDGLCPHQRGHLAESGRAEAVVTCPRVGCLRWRFDTRTGACLQLGRVRLRTYAVRVEAGSVFLAANCSGASQDDSGAMGLVSNAIVPQACPAATLRRSVGA
jgi:nitrite reductase (NADH) small subunit